MNDQQQSRADALTDEHIATLKLAARAVTPQDIDGAERIESRPDGSYITCPACEGEGCIPFESDYCNYDHVAIGVQFYGVGTEPGAAEAYFRAAKPATILALLDRLERAESALAAPPVEQPAAAPADERAALPQIPDLVKATAWLTMCLRTELSRLDDDTHKALDEVEAQLSCVRAITNGAIDYEAMVAARAAASPAAEAVAFEVTEEIAADWAKRHDIEHVLKHHSTQRNAIEDARTLHLLDAPQPAQAASPAAVAVATVEVGSMEHGPFTFQTTPYGADTLPKGVHSLYTAPPAARVASLTNSQREAIEFAAKTMEARMLNAHACVLRALLNGADKS